MGWRPLILKHIFYNKKLKERARMMRRNMTVPEKKIWEELLSKDQMLGLRFLRQKPIDHFIVDFYCSKLRIVVEIDGSSHLGDQPEAYDNERTLVLKKYGIVVYRYTNDEVLNSIERVAEDLKEKIKARIEEL